MKLEAPFTFVRNQTDFNPTTPSHTMGKTLSETGHYDRSYLSASTSKHVSSLNLIRSCDETGLESGTQDHATS